MSLQVQAIEQGSGRGSSELAGGLARAGSVRKAPRLRSGALAFVWVRARLAALAGFAALSAAGCSTVVMREPTSTQAADAGRSELVLAAEAVSEVKWPKPEGAGLSGMLGGGERVTEADSVEAYVGALGAGPGRGVAVLKDAYVHIDAAYRLAAAADRASTLARPTDDDVRLIEGAIGDLRGARDIYLASLRELDGAGDGVEPRTEQSLKAAFNQAIRNIGEAADALSDHVAATKLRADAARRVVPAAPARFSGR